MLDLVLSAIQVACETQNNCKFTNKASFFIFVEGFINEKVFSQMVKLCTVIFLAFTLFLPIVEEII